MASQPLVKDFIEKEYMELKSNERKCACCGEVECEFDEREEDEKKGKTFILIKLESVFNAFRD